MTYVGVVSLPVRRSRSSCLIDISQSYRSKTRVTDVTPRLLVSSDWILCITTSHRSLNVSNFDSSSAWSRAVPSMMYAVWLSWDTASAWILSQLDSNFLAKSALVVFRIVPSSLKREVVQEPVRETTHVLRWHLSALTQPGAVEIGLQNPSLFCLFCWMSERFWHVDKRRSLRPFICVPEAECPANDKPLLYEGDVTFLSNFEEIDQSDWDFA